MARSVKKGPFIDKSVQQAVERVHAGHGWLNVWCAQWQATLADLCYGKHGGP